MAPIPETNGTAPSQTDDALSLFSLSARTIIVTGATGGMGLSVIKAILQAGADVIAIDREESPKSVSWDDVQATADKTGTSLSYWNCDISDLDTTYASFEKAVSIARFPLRGLVNCAGIGIIGPSISFPIATAKRIIDVNLVGTLVCAQAAARLVEKHSLSASFVFIASMSGYIVNKGTPNAAYAASKAGVQQLTRNLASEWGHREDGPSIRVNSVSPGVIRTPMTAGVLSMSNFDQMWTEESMLKRLSVPDDYRGPVIFLLSDASSYVTGADLLVDGGYTKW
ncbi:Gluconate 5-dehydrogenase [Pleurostoma richardsiae]|uniref:Gluconate 5-dehydrogenase n=1 Tax=Pleurostoma richardsiae TaxID=41990 RepID=A0AA38RML2_9PEZI|nr:Gluconate 5-dehydrogenase [Pleurostoma richardsiae]